MITRNNNQVSESNSISDNSRKSGQTSENPFRNRSVSNSEEEENNKLAPSGAATEEGDEDDDDELTEDDDYFEEKDKEQ